MTPLAVAFDALSGAGTPFRLRKGVIWHRPTSREVDLWIEARDLPGAERALGAAGFRRATARGHGRHRFFVTERDGRWLKLDVKLPARGLAARWDGSGPARTVRSLLRRIPLSPHRAGPVIAVVGPDGAGKGTVIRELRERVPLATATVYLGARRRAPQPPAPPAGDGTRDGNGVPLPGSLRQVAFVLRNAARTWRRLLPAYARAWRGAIVLCDRHPLELLAIQPDRAPAAEVLERLLVRLIPRPDAIVVLDAPADVLYRRKPEHPVERLERWRAAYAESLKPLGAVEVGTTDSLDLTMAQVSRVVWDALRARRGW